LAPLGYSELGAQKFQEMPNTKKFALASLETPKLKAQEFQKRLREFSCFG
jgi:hypothetical protein